MLTHSESFPSLKPHNPLITWTKRSWKIRKFLNANFNFWEFKKLYIFTITRFVASKPGKVLTYGGMLSSQTFKSSLIPCSCWYYSFKPQIMNKTFTRSDRMYNIRKRRNFSAIQQESVKYGIETMSYGKWKIWGPVIYSIKKAKNL